MTKYWKSIQKRLHEESALHHPYNTVGNMFEVFFDGILNDFTKNEKLFNDQSFLLTASGLYLDIKGKELGLPRKEGEYAQGNVVFILTKEIPETQTPALLTNDEEDGVILDYEPEKVQRILTQYNTERKNDKDIETLLECRTCTADFIIPMGSEFYSDNGVQYILTKDVKFTKGSYITTGTIKSKESGSPYNLAIGDLIDNPTHINKDLFVLNTELITGGREGESDEEYRRRLFNNINTNISINYLKRQGIIIYSKKNLNEDVRTKMTSFNPYLSNKYAVIPPNNEVMDFVKNELLTKNCFVIYVRGW